MDATATTTFTPGPIPPRRIAAWLQPPGQRLQVEAVGQGNAARAELERYVGAAFQARHGAVVRSFMPTLLAFRDCSGGLRGVAGVRGAHEERLYLEQYLARPIEQALAAALETQGVGSISRRDIAEVGNLAGAGRLAAVRMVAHIPAWLMSQRYAWIVFTATNSLRQMLAGLDAPLIELARADGARVATSGDEWGRYYETDPRVYAGRLYDAERLAGFAHAGES